jgi:hypothetical protein
LSELTVGNRLEARESHGRVYLETVGGQGVARLSNGASEQWKDKLSSVEKIRVVAVVQQGRDNTPPEFRAEVACETWEVPVFEVVYRDRQGRT